MGRYRTVIVMLVALSGACTSPARGPSADVSAQTITTLPPITTTTVAVTTTTVPAAPTTTVPARGRIVISGIGDVNLDPAFVRTFPSTGYDDAWTGLSDAFVLDDLTVVNLECAPSDLGTPWEKPWTFRCDPDALPSMAAAGVDVANLANNHSMDYGMEAMLDGRNNLLAVGIEPVGVGANRAEAYTPVFVTVKGWRIAIIGSGGVHPETGTWTATDDTPGMTAGDDTESIAAAIREAKQDADIVIVTAHWGKSYEAEIGDFERTQAEAWIAAGADGIFGHHQHLLLPMEWVDDRPVAFGLGNFVWQAHPPEARRTAIAQFVFEPDGTKRACLVPVVLERTGHPVVEDPSIIGCPDTP